jgi:hypothetical protein
MRDPMATLTALAVIVHTTLTAARSKLITPSGYQCAYTATMLFQLVWRLSTVILALAVPFANPWKQGLRSPVVARHLVAYTLALVALVGFIHAEIAVSWVNYGWISCNFSECCSDGDGDGNDCVSSTPWRCKGIAVQYYRNVSSLAASTI